MGLFKNKKKQVENNNVKEKKKINFTIYSYRKDYNDLIDILKYILKDTIINIEQSENNIMITFFDNTKMQIYMLLDKDEIKKQIIGMTNYFANVKIEDEELKTKILTQISMFNNIISIWFEIDDNKEKMNYLIESIHLLSQKLAGFILYPDMSLFHNDGRILISLDGKTDFTKETFSPIASSSILEKDIKETTKDIDRKLKSIEILKEKNIPYMEHLKCTVYEQEAIIWSKDDIIKRLACIFGASVRAEVYSSGQYKDCDTMAKDMIKTLNDKYNILDNFTKEELSYITGENNNHAKFGWRYECCSVLLWALSLIKLKEPTEICDASEIGKILWENDFNSLLEKSNLKSKDEILDLQDLVLRYDWACVDSRIKNKPLPQLNGEIICEWHYALNWLVQAYGITNWDNVKTHT